MDARPKFCTGVQAANCSIKYSAQLLSFFVPICLRKGVTARLEEILSRGRIVSIQALGGLFWGILATSSPSGGVGAPATEVIEFERKSDVDR
jgi:hypothetical protein